MLQIKVKVGLVEDDGEVEQIENSYRRTQRYWKIGCKEHYERDSAESCSKDLQITV